jgi:hypothetical protein
VPLIYSRGYDKAWIYGALRVRDGQVLTQTAPARNTAGYLDLLGAIDRDTPDGELYLITDNLSSHTSGHASGSPPTRGYVKSSSRWALLG